MSPELQETWSITREIIKDDLHENYDLRTLYGAQIAEILSARPDLEPFFDLRKLWPGDIVDLLISQPQLFSKFKLKELGSHNTCRLLTHRPEFLHKVKLVGLIDVDVRFLLDNLFKKIKNQ